MKTIINCLILLSLVLPVRAQSGRPDVRQGNRYFKNEKFDKAEVAYRKALEGKKVGPVAGFNLGDALYKQKKFEEAGNQFQAAASSTLAKNDAAKAYHNLGNSYLQAGKIDESISAYKDALRKNPTDLSTKYNLSYAQMMKKKQEQEQKKDDQKKDGQSKDDQTKDNQSKDGQKKDSQSKDNQSKDGQQKDQQKQQQQQQQQPNVKISKEDAKRLLEALANDEKKVQDKVKKEKASASKVRTLKDW